MRLIIAPRARADLAAIIEYIEADSPARAASFALELEEACTGLLRYPLRFPQYISVRTGPLRRRAFGAYLIFYRVSDDAIEIARIVHGARDYRKLLDLDA